MHDLGLQKLWAQCIINWNAFFAHIFDDSFCSLLMITSSSSIEPMTGLSPYTLQLVHSQYVDLHLVERTVSSLIGSLRASSYLGEPVMRHCFNYVRNLEFLFDHVIYRTSFLHELQLELQVLHHILPCWKKWTEEDTKRRKRISEISEHPRK